MKTYMKKEKGKCPVALTIANANIFHNNEVSIGDITAECPEDCKETTKCPLKNKIQNKLKNKKGIRDKNWIINNLPVEVTVTYYGKPTPVLIVDFDVIKNKVLLVNYHKGSDVWVSLSDLFKKMTEDAPSKWIKTQ